MSVILIFLLEIIVVGTGDKSLRLDPKIQSYLRKHNIALEVQDTVSKLYYLSSTGQ